MATILIVDDLSADRTLMATILGHQGHRMLEAADGNEGLAIVQAEHPDLVITDVLMPGMDGYELVRRLRLDPTTSATPVVFCTAQYGKREARAFALSSGVADVLTKPAPSSEVLRVIGRVLSGTSASAAGTPDVSQLSPEFDREHLRLLTDKLSENTTDLKIANARLRALINIGLELASERDVDRLLQGVSTAARDLFSATYTTLGIVQTDSRTVTRFVACGAAFADSIKTGDRISGILGTVVAERRTVRGDTSGGDPAALALPFRHPNVQAFLAAPVVSPTQVYGWICLVRNQRQPFTEEDEQLVTALSGQVGRIYENGYFSSVAKKQTEELRHERDRAQRYLDTAEVILLALDLHRRITLINRKGCDLLGRQEVELLGRDWVDCCVPERVRDASTREFIDLVGGDLSIVYGPILTSSGTERMIEWRNTVLRDDDGRVIGTFSSGSDVTERHHAVEALRTAEERMRFALEAAAVGIWDMDYATSRIHWSETLAAQYGVPPGTGEGTLDTLTERVHPQDRDALVETMMNARRAAGDFVLEHRTVWADGTVRWLRGAGRVHVGEHGEPERAVGIIQDVTDRRMLEAQFQQAQKMDAVGRLAGGVAHDFNNLLTVILGHCELLLSDLGPDDPTRTDITQIQKAGASAAGLTRQLLAFSRKQIIEPTLLDLNVVVTNIRAMLGRLIGEDVKVVLRLRPDLALVKADRGQVEQVVMNLAVNARDAMPNGGALTIETANIELDEHYPKTHLAVKPGQYVVLTVSDTGMGMTPEVQARLFEPFFTTKEVGRGSGLGLATVHGVVARSGGSVNVYSEVGRGTSFKVYLPRADSSEATVEAPQPVARPGVRGGQTVLVVDDADGLRELARSLLQRQGYTVLVAANADEALRLFERNPSIDVLLTDVVMPGASGPELTKRLIEQRPALKVVYMSGYTEDTIVHHGVLHPGIVFLNKPFTSETLAQKIHEVLDR